MSLFSWGEQIEVQLVDIGNGQTKLQVISVPKVGMNRRRASDLGKNRKNIDAIISATSQQLQSFA